MVGKRTLILLSGLVWLAAGFNVFRFGALEWSGRNGWLLALLASLVFVLFFFMFQHMTVKNTDRIIKIKTERTLFLNFFTARSYAIVAFMIALGVTLRSIPAVPKFFIAFFYTGLGTALFVAGVRYLLNFGRFDALLGQARE